LVREYRASGLAQPQAWLTEAVEGGRTLAGENVSVKGALAIADVFSCVNMIAGDVSLCPLKVYRDQSLSASNPGTAIEEAPNHRAWKLLHDSPCPYVPAHRFWATIAAHELLWGNWFVEKLRDDTGQVDEIRALDPSAVEIEYNWQTGGKRFWVTRLTGEREGPFANERILHGFGTYTDGIVGLSPIQQARESVA
jgi:HK97 family phage portal protein